MARVPPLIYKKGKKIKKICWRRGFPTIVSFPKLFDPPLIYKRIKKNMLERDFPTIVSFPKLSDPQEYIKNI